MAVSRCGIPELTTPMTTIEVSNGWWHTDNRVLCDDAYKFLHAQYAVFNIRGWVHFQYDDQINGPGRVCVECRVPLKPGICAWEYQYPPQGGENISEPMWMCTECGYLKAVSEGHDLPPVPDIFVVEC